MTSEHDTQAFRRYERMDLLSLRVLIVFSLLALAAAISNFYLHDLFDPLCLWTMVGALGIGLTASLGYLIHLLWKHLQMSLLFWLLLFVLHSGMMACVISAPVWLGDLQDGGFGGISWRWVLNTLLCAAALTGVLLTETVIALLIAPWMPSFCVRVITVERSHGLFRREEMVAPKLGVWLLYVTAPFALWVGLQCGYYLWALGGGHAGLQILLGVCGTVVLMRMLMDPWVMLNVWLERRQSKRTGQVHHARRLGWLLYRNGLMAAWLLCFYAFCWLGTRTQQEALSQQLRAQRLLLDEQLDAMAPRDLPSEVDARPLHEQALTNYAYPNTHRIFVDQWLSPHGADHLRNHQGQLEAMRQAARRPHYSPGWRDAAGLARYTEANQNLLNQRGMGASLMMEARWAALRGDLRRLLENADAALTLTNRMGQGPLLIESMVALGTTSDVVMAMHSALLTPYADPPSDEILAEAQKLVRRHRLAWNGLYAQMLRIESLATIKYLDDSYTHGRETWQDSVAPHDLLRTQPLAFGMGRHSYLNEMDALARISEPTIDPVRLRTWQAAFAHAPSRRFEPWTENSGIYRPSLVLIDIMCEMVMVETSIGVLRYKRAYGRWPESLEACVPRFMDAVPRDPYVPDRPLGWALDPPRIYSLGLNGVDQSATHLQHTSGPNTVDHLYAWTRGNNYDENRIHFLDMLLDPYAEFKTLPYGQPGLSQDQRHSALVSQFHCACNFIYHTEIAEALNREYNDPVPSPTYALRPFLIRGDTEVTLTALDAVALMGPIARELTPVIAGHLTSKDAETRMWALYALGRVGPAERDADNDAARDALRGWQMVTPGDPYEQWYLDVARRRFLKEEAAAGR